MALTDFSSLDILRWGAALALITIYVAFSYHRFRLFRVAAGAGHDGRDFSAPSGTITEQGWVIYASQGGQAEAIARNCARALVTASRQVHLRRIEEDWMHEMAGARFVLFVVSTHGEGGSPDHAIRFARTVIDSGMPQAALRGMRYGVLALGDSHYQHFCAFGRRLDQWLQGCGAIALFDRVDVDHLDAVALQTWQQQLGRLGASGEVAVSAADREYGEWEFVARRGLNDGSLGAPICLVTLRPPGADLPAWQAGDLVEVKVPGDDAHPRTYSIANLPGDGCVELIVRLHLRADGSPGIASGWLVGQASAGDVLSLRIRNNPGFHLHDDLARPLILIGSGAGIAGLRAHLKARAALIGEAGGTIPERSAWLFFGERSGKHDHLCELELDGWKRSGVLTRMSLAFSRDDPVTPYVQHCLLAQSAEFSEWVAAGANILICGSAEKMAVGVDEALRRILGTAQVDALLEGGRIRRDVF